MSRLIKFEKQLREYNNFSPPADTLFEEIRAFYDQQKANAEDIKKLGHVEYRMWGFIERIAKRRIKCGI